MERRVIDERILSAFQAHKGIVPQPPIFDGTGHVDMFMKIVSSDTVLVGEYQPGQLGYHVLEDCATLFESATNGADEPWNVVRIPQPVVYFEDFICFRSDKDSLKPVSRMGNLFRPCSIVP